jgi:pyruvate kinase
LDISLYNCKIERSGALDHIDEIIEAAGGDNDRKGDLGVEIPIERIAVVQERPDETSKYAQSRYHCNTDA